MSQDDRVSSLPETEFLSKVTRTVKTGNNDIFKYLSKINLAVLDVMGTLSDRKYPGWKDDQEALSRIANNMVDLKRNIGRATEQFQVLCFNRTINEGPEAGTSDDVQSQLLKQIEETHKTQGLTADEKAHVKLLSESLDTSVEDLTRHILPSVTVQDNFPTCAKEAKALEIRGIVEDSNGIRTESWEFSHGGHYRSPGAAKLTITFDKSASE